MEALYATIRLKKGEYVVTSRTVKLAGKFGPSDWTTRAAEIAKSSSADLWARTATEFLVGRIRPRYLVPISEMKKLNKLQGEGFAVVTIQCALIEFLAALRSGENYQYKKPNPKKHEYNDSRRLFKDFLSKVSPFSNTFKSLAADFYSDIRCGLLHEGQTKGGWLVKRRGKGSAVIDLGPPRIIYWEPLQDMIEAYLAAYQKDLETDTGLQAAFVRKFGHLATSV